MGGQAHQFATGPARLRSGTAGGICLPCVAPYLGYMLSLSSISTSVCHALLHTWGTCSLSPVYQHLFAQCCTILGMHALFSVSTYVCQTCSLLGMHALLSISTSVCQALLDTIYQRLFARRCSILGMHALSPVYQRLFARRCSILGMHALSPVYQRLLRYNNYCLSTVNTNQDRFMDYL